MTAASATLAIAGPPVSALLQGYHGFHGFGGMDAVSVVAAALGGLFSLALLLLIVAVVWRLFRGGGRGPGAPARGEPESPLEVLERRYARGEIEREDFLQKRDDLRKS